LKQVLKFSMSGWKLKSVNYVWPSNASHSSQLFLRKSLQSFVSLSFLVYSLFVLDTATQRLTFPLIITRRNSFTHHSWAQFHPFHLVSSFFVRKWILTSLKNPLAFNLSRFSFLLFLIVTNVLPIHTF